MPKVNPAQVKEFAFGSLDRGANSKLVKAPNLLKADNVDMSNTGEIRKRKGLYRDETTYPLYGILGSDNVLESTYHDLGTTRQMVPKVFDAANNAPDTVVPRSNSQENMANAYTPETFGQYSHSGWVEFFTSHIAPLGTELSTVSDMDMAFYEDASNPENNRIFVAYSGTSEVSAKEVGYWAVLNGDIDQPSILASGSLGSMKTPRVAICGTRGWIAAVSTTGTAYVKLRYVDLLVATPTLTAGSVATVTTLIAITNPYDGYDLTSIGDDFVLMGPATTTRYVRFEKYDGTTGALSAAAVTTTLCDNMVGCAPPNFGTAYADHRILALYYVYAAAGSRTIGSYAWDASGTPTYGGLVGTLQYGGKNEHLVSMSIAGKNVIGGEVVYAYTVYDNGNVSPEHKLWTVIGNATWAIGGAGWVLDKEDTFYGVIGASRVSDNGTRVLLENVSDEQPSTLYCKIEDNGAGVGGSHIDVEPISTPLTFSGGVQKAYNSGATYGYYNTLCHMSEAPTTDDVLDYTANTGIKSYITGTLKLVRILSSNFFGQLAQKLPVVARFLDGAKPPYVTTRDNLYVGGGKPHKLGVNHDLTAAPFYPETFSLTANGSGGNMHAGTYWYVVTFETLAADGTRWVSTPTAAQSVVAVSNDSIDIDIRVPPFMPANGRYYVYRTLLTDTTNFYKIAEDSAGLGTAGVITIVDTEADSQIDESEILYTIGGILENVAPPNPHVMSKFGDRIAHASNEYPGVVFMSKPVVNGEIQHNQALQVQCPNLGRITGLAELNGTLIALGKYSIAAISGTGYNNAAVGPGWFVTTLSAHSGADSRVSVTSTPAGITAQFGGQMYMFTRDYQRDDRFFDPIDRLVNGAPVRAVHYSSRKNELYVVTNDGKLCIYCFQTAKWSCNEQLSVLDVTDWERGLCIIDESYYKWTERSVFTDSYDTGSGRANVDVPFIVESGWVKTSELNQEMRVMWLDFLFEYVDGHTLSIDVYYDYEETSSENHTLAVSSDMDPYRVRVKPLQERCTAVRVKITDSTTGTESFRLIGFSAEFDSSNALGRLPAAQTIA